MKPKVLPTKITLLEGNYEDIPMKDAQVDIAWSQEAFSHCGDRAKPMREVFRILPGGEFVADPRDADRAGVEVLQPMLDRANSSFGTVEGHHGRSGGLQGSRLRRSDGGFPNQLSYDRGRNRARHDELKQEISEAFLEKIGSGMQYWVYARSRAHGLGAVSTLAGVGGSSPSAGSGGFCLKRPRWAFAPIHSRSTRQNRARGPQVRRLILRSPRCGRLEGCRTSSSLHS